MVLKILVISGGIWYYATTKAQMFIAFPASFVAALAAGALTAPLGWLFSMMLALALIVFMAWRFFACQVDIFD